VYKIKLTKIKSTHNNLRTDTIEGVCHELPEVGAGFSMYGAGLEFGVRSVRTSRIEEVDETTTRGGKYMTFKTMNSEYHLEILDVLEEETQPSD